MPAQWDLPRASNLWDVQDVDRYNRLPVWVADQQTKGLPTWSRWEKLLGTIKWQANSGDTMQGVIAELPPVTKQFHTPRNITESPLKTVVSHFERGNIGRVKRHLFESPQFHFLPSFRDFRRKQVSFAVKALNKIVACGADAFYRWQVLNQSRRVFIVGSTDGNYLQGAGGNVGEATDVSSPKDGAWFASMANKVGAAGAGFLDFRKIIAVRDYASEDMGMVPWDGMPTIPKENEIMKGKYILLGEAQLYSGLTWDNHILNFKDYAMNLINSEFRGIIGGNIAFLQERYPLRFSLTADGTSVTWPEPELEEAQAEALPTGNTSGHETVPNPDYVNAQFGIAFLVGYLPYEVIKIGPPPEEFASGNISMGKFHKLNWNGEVRITDDVLIKLADGTFDTNKYGEVLQLICDTVLGIVPNTPRFCLPIIYRRVKAPSLQPTL